MRTRRPVQLLSLHAAFGPGLIAALFLAASLGAAPALAQSAQANKTSERLGGNVSAGITAGITAGHPDADAIAARLAGAIRIPTISPAEPADFEGQPFLDLHAYLRTTYPLVHQHLEVETVSDYSLLFTWRGTRPELDGAVFMSHLDVVPVEPGTEMDWTHPPFSGEIADGFVWGRGALDVKCGVIVWLEAVESLLQQGLQPERTIYLAFGHDEEIGGNHGAARLAETLESRGARIALLFDEGGGIVSDNLMLPGQTTAMVFVAEKTYLTLRLTARGRGGHSSMPPRITSVTKLSSAIHRLSEKPMPARLTPSMRAMLEAAAPYQKGLRGLALRNLWLTERSVVNSMLEDDLQRVMVQTSMAPTIIRGGVKDNVVPTSAEAFINFRLLPGDTNEDVVAHVRRAIDDPEIEIEALAWTPAPPQADIEGEAFALIRDSVLEVVPEAVLLPALLPAATDTRHYTRIAKNVYRFVPVRYSMDLMEGFHGRNERLPVAPLGQAVEVAIGMMRRSAMPSAAVP